MSATKSSADTLTTETILEHNLTAMSALSGLPAFERDMYASFRGFLSEGVSWLLRHEQYKDAASMRNMMQAAFGVKGSYGVISAYLSSVGKELVPGVKELYALYMSTLEDRLKAEADIIR